MQRRVILQRSAAAGVIAGALVVALVMHGHGSGGTPHASPVSPAPVGRSTPAPRSSSTTVTPPSRPRRPTTTTVPLPPAVDRPLRLDDDDHRRDLAEVGRRDGNRSRVRAEHDVPPHDDRVRRRGCAREDDPRQRRSRELRLPGSRRAVARRAGRGCGQPGSPVLLRHELLDVRRRLRAGGQRQLRRPRWAVAELRVPRRSEDARDHRCHAGRDGARSTSRSRPTTATSS